MANDGPCHHLGRSLAPRQPLLLLLNPQPLLRQNGCCDAESLADDAVEDLGDGAGGGGGHLQPICSRRAVDVPVDGASDTMRVLERR